MIRRALFCASFATLLACGNERREAPRSAPAPVNQAPVTPTIEGLVVHEWGLIDVTSGRTSRSPLTLSGPPGRSPERQELIDSTMEDNPALQKLRPRPQPSNDPAPIARPRAPILYAHLPAGHEPLEVLFRVAIAGGTIEEHWPLTERHEPSFEWVQWNARVRPENCQGASYPRNGEAPCDNPARMYCEASELRRFETRDSACLTIADVDANHLFYRGITTGALALDARKDAARVRVHASADDRIEGALLWVRRSDRREDTRVRIARAPVPGTGSDLDVPDQPAEAGWNALERALRERYEMTADEVAAFREAWDIALFGGPHAPHELTRPGAFVPPVDSLLYFLPRTLVDRIAPLTIEPSPARITRAILVRVDLDPRPRSFLVRESAE